MVKRAAVPAEEGTPRGQGQRLVSYQGNGLFQASDRAARSVPLEPEALGYPISLAPVAQSDGLVEHTERLLEDPPAFRSVDRTDRYRYEKIDPYHWTESVDRELVASEVEAVLSDGTTLKGHGSALFIEDRKVDGGRLEADRSGVQLSRFLKGEVVQTQQSRGALSALTGGKLVSTKTNRSVDYVNRVVQSVRPDGEMEVQRWALPQNIASARVDMVRADRHLISPDGSLTSTGAYDTSLTDDGQILIGRIDHFTQRIQVPEELQNLELLVRPESVGHERPQA